MTHTKDIERPLKVRVDYFGADGLLVREFASCVAFHFTDGIPFLSYWKKGEEKPKSIDINLLGELKITVL